MAKRLFIWFLFCFITGAIFLIYAFTSLAAGRGEFLLPLDDVYIHFQYAKQMANGQPYIYNPGHPPTSGATSFIYPYLLAAGYLLGFQDLNLSLWAMIVGALALLGSLWVVYNLLKAFDAPDWLAVMIALIFGLTGPVSWHFMSGMETGLMILFTLATLYGVVTLSLRRFIISAALLALTRPEGGVLAVIAAAVFTVSRTSAIRETPQSIRKNPLLFVPVLAVFVQPFVNLLMTGSVVATGNSVKSIFGTVPFYWDMVIGRILENFARMWVEFITGVSPREGLYIPYLVGPLALAFLIGGLFSRKYRLINALLLLWLLAGTASIATLDTAFWHFKRYQMPLIALLFPLAGWALLEIQRTGIKYALQLLLGAGLILTLTTGAAFVHHFALNVNYVYLQPLQMTRWLQANTAEDAVIAVHDVGMMRYMGGRTTLDMVGLTTLGAAAYWRNGPGSIAEFLIQERPDYIASYGKGHGYGLELIANTPIYGSPLAEFPVDLDPNYNVALAADFQGIYQPDWDVIAARRSVQPSLNSYIDFERADGINELSVNVADIGSENYRAYTWASKAGELLGFPSDLHELHYPHCETEDCQFIDGGRRIDAQEQFSFDLIIDSGSGHQPIVLVTRLHAETRGTFDVFVDNEYVATRWIPEMPGRWLDVPTWIPEEYFSDPLNIRVVPHVEGGYYSPYFHTIYTLQSTSPLSDMQSTNLAEYQEGAVFLSDMDYSLDKNSLTMSLDWYTDGSAEGDYRFFVHLYNDINQPPIAQYDDYPGNGTLPPGNWLPGVLHDMVTVDLTDVPSGMYSLALGFYNPYTGERLMPESDVYEVSADGRLWLGEVEVPAEGD